MNLQALLPCFVVNFMKIEAKMTTLRCFEKIRFYMKYIAKNELVRILIARYCIYAKGWTLG